MRQLYFDRSGKPMELLEWAAGFEENDRHVKKDHVRCWIFPLRVWWVSTVWLGLDHDLLGGGPPLIFETMVFPGEAYVERYSTEEGALEGHKRAVRWARWHPSRLSWWDVKWTVKRKLRRLFFR